MTINNKLTEYVDIREEMMEFYGKKLASTLEHSKFQAKQFIDHLRTDGVSFETLKNSLTMNPRVVSDFMDEKDLIILITRKNNLFSYTVNGKEFDFEGSRSDAETQAAIYCLDEYKKTK